MKCKKGVLILVKKKNNKRPPSLIFKSLYILLIHYMDGRYDNKYIKLHKQTLFVHILIKHQQQH